MIQMTPDDLLQLRASQSPDLIAHSVGSRSMTFRQWHRGANLIADRLATAGISAGQAVELRYELTEFDHFAVAYVGAQRAGAVPVPVPTTLRPAELEHVRASARTGFQISAGDTRDSPSISRLNGAQTYRWPADTAEVILTSGTTGLPQGVRCAHAEVTYGWDERAIDEDDRSHELHGAAFGTNYAQEMLRGPLLWGSRVHTLPVPSGGTVVDAVRDGGVRVLRLTPSLAAALIRALAGEVLESVETVSLSSAYAPPELSARLQEALPNAVIVNQYSLTESGRAKLKSVWGKDPVNVLGLPVEGTEVRIWGNEAEVNGVKVGEIQLRHRDAPPRSLIASTLRPLEGPADDWLSTGDLGFKDEAGYIVLVDRAKDLINVGGRKVSPLAIEAQILKAPHVLDVAVAGIPHPLLGEVIGAVVAFDGPRPGTLATLAEGLLAHEVPVRYEVVDAIPRNRAGKVSRLQVRELLLAAESAIDQSDPSALATGGDHRVLSLISQILELPAPPRPGLSWYATGGDSLAAVELMAIVEDEWDIELDVQLFDGDHKLSDIVDFVNLSQHAAKA